MADESYNSEYKVPAGSNNTPLQEVFEGVGKRFGLFRIFQWEFPTTYPTLVDFELKSFPNPTTLKSTAADNYLLIFDGLQYPSSSTE
jgi:hypothetical protein